MSKLRFKAAPEPVDPATMPGYGRDQNPVKDFAERSGILFDGGYPCTAPSVKPLILDMAEKTQDGKHAYMMAVRLNFEMGVCEQDPATGEISLNLLGTELIDIARLLQQAARTLSSIERKAQEDPQLASYMDL